MILCFYRNISSQKRSPLNEHWDHCSAVGIAMRRGEGILSRVCEVIHSFRYCIERLPLLDGETEQGRTLPETRMLSLV